MIKSSQFPLKISIIIPIFQVRKLRLRELNSFTRGAVFMKLEVGFTPRNSSLQNLPRTSTSRYWEYGYVSSYWLMKFYVCTILME